MSTTMAPDEIEDGSDDANVSTRQALFGKEFYPPSRRPPYFHPDRAVALGGGSGSGSGAFGIGPTPQSSPRQQMSGGIGGGGGAGAYYNPSGGANSSMVGGGGGGAAGASMRRDTASALGLDLLEAAVAAGGVSASASSLANAAAAAAAAASASALALDGSADASAAAAAAGSRSSRGAQQEADAAAGGDGTMSANTNATATATAGDGGVSGASSGAATPRRGASRRTSLTNILLSPFGGGGGGGDGQQQQQQDTATIPGPMGSPRRTSSVGGGSSFASASPGGGLLASPRTGSSLSASNLLLPPSMQSNLALGQQSLGLQASQSQQQQIQQMHEILEVDIPTWRLKERMKTVGVGMILALNIGTDPPDVQKPNPCAKLQCWIDPTTMSRAKARERIGEKLEAQYARWQQRAKLKYKRALDPTVEDVRSLCASMRRQARNDRLLLHYNGHGVPRPTADGEIYVFDKNHTHFIPLSVLDLRRWIDKPTIVVLDCSGAGVLMPYLTGALDHQLLLAQQQGGLQGGGGGGAGDVPQHQSSPSILAMATPMQQQQQQRRSYGNAADTMNAMAGGGVAGGIGRMAGETEAAYAARTVTDTIVLCPTSPGDLLPMGPEFPADLFTSCLTTPIPIALRWFVHRNPLSRASMLDPSRVDSIPGKINDRKTPLGELNWIFTAITDTIAWQVLPSSLFQRLFRQDLIVASMFRNFLLADRILRTLNCTPMSHPALPSTHDHPLWLSWDLAVETCLDQLMKEGVLVDEASEKRAVSTAASNDGEGIGGGETGSNIGAGIDTTQGQVRPPHPASLVPTASAAVSQAPRASNTQPIHITAPFFAEQLTAFEIWLEFASLRLHGSEEGQILRFGDPLVNGNTSSCYFYLEPPEQLPVVLQVLLSQAHRVRALALLRRFLDLGNAAINLALSVGIFPYVLKLLQSSIDEYKHVLVGIWAKILLFDSSCQADLVKDGALPHFIRHLHWRLPDSGTGASPNLANRQPLVGGDDGGASQRTMAAVILSSICSDYPLGQKECLAKNLHGFCASLLSSVEYLSTVEGSSGIEFTSGAKRMSISEERVPEEFRLWLCLCLGALAKDNVTNQAELCKTSVHLRLIERLNDDSSGVRASACYALACLIGFAPPDESAEDSNVPGPGPASGGLVNPALLPGVLPSSGQQMTNLAPSFLPPASTGLPLQTETSNGSSTGINLSWQVPQQSQQGLQLQGMQPLSQLNPDHAQLSSSMGSGLLPSPSNLGAHGAQQQPMAPLQSHSHAAGGQQQLLNPQYERVAVKTVYQDHKRLDIDLLCAEHLSSLAKDDGSPTVRHEAIISLATFVAKYIQAFVAVADEWLVGGSTAKTTPVIDLPLRDNQLPTILDEGDEIDEDEDSAGSGRRPIPLPDGVNISQGKIFTELWKSIQSMQRKEPYEYASLVLSNMVSGVNENLLVLRTRIAEEEMKQQIEQVGAGQSRPLDRNAAASDLLSDFTPVAPPALPLRRHQTDSQVTLSTATTTTSSDLPSSAKSTNNRDVRPSMSRRWSINFKAQYSGPASKFYDWKRTEFGERLTSQERAASPLLDPLSNEGAVQIYREKRNLALHKESENLSERFACLAPKPQQKRRTLYGGGTDLDILNAGLNDAASKAKAAFDDVVASKKQALHLGQAGMLLNKDKRMTSMLKFHAYESALVVSDGGNTVSLWDINTAKRINSFRNGSSKSRNTSVTWVNEMSSSLLMIGTDDGIIRIYDGLIEDSGGISRIAPQLATAFVAAPDLDVGKRGGSGLVTEWQQFSGRLLAGGSSKTIYCWDLESERCRATFESNLGSCATTITTAWDYTSSDLQSGSSGYSGIGPDIFVAGFGNGAIKVYDIRAKMGPVGDIGPSGSTTDYQSSGSSVTRRSRRPPKLMQYAEHSSWIVNTAFTGFGGRYEICSGCVAGDIRFFDLRIPESIRTLDVQRSPMTALACHPGIPFFATGSHAQFIKILSMDGDTLQVIRYHEEIAGQRMGPVSCLAFHPHRPLLAAGATDEIISLYSPK